LLLKKLINVMPMIPVSLKKQIKAEFPFHKQPTFKITAYVHNLLLMAENHTLLINDIVELLLDRMLTMDTSVTKKELEELCDDDDDSDSDSEDDDVPAEAETPQSRLMGNPIATTLDMCLDQFYSYVKEKLGDGTTASRAEQDAIVSALISYFENHVLQTHNTKHVQFVFFYVASIRSSFLQHFVSCIWQRAVDRNQSVATRQTSIGYLSSFLARAKFVPVDMLMTYMRKLSSWAHEYIRSCDYKKNKNPKAHIVFFAVSQAIFYVIAFRSREFLLDDDNLRLTLKLDLPAIVKHPLNPLNYCLPAVDNIRQRNSPLPGRLLSSHHREKCQPQADNYLCQRHLQA